MITKCAWCGKEIPQKEHEKDVATDKVTHGVCKECARIMMENMLTDHATRRAKATP